jgi:copper chaperone CopZ
MRPGRVPGCAAMAPLPVERTMDTLHITVEGMNCGHCLETVRSTLAGVDGVTVEHVVLGEATVQFDPRRTTPERICETVSDVGYLAYPAAPRVAP